MVDENLLAGYLQHLSFTHVDIPEGAPRHEYDAILKKQEALIKENPFFWAWEELDDLCSKDPHGALETIVEIVNRSPRLEYLSSVGAGPLESLLVTHAFAINDEVEAYLQTNVRFRYAFTYGRYVDIPLEIIDRWIGVFRELGTTKEGTRRDYHEAMKAGA